MIKRCIAKALRFLGYEIHKISPCPQKRIRPTITEPPPVNPAWPLPRRPDGPSDEEIREEFAKFDFWHYAYKFDGNLSFSAHHNKPESHINEPERPLQRFRHFMPYLLEAHHGSLQGKRVLDIACNSGFWSIQCAFLDAEVVGFDARPELIEQANLIKSIVGLNNVEFKVLDFWSMSPQTLGNTFDIVLNLGILYHLPKPLQALELTKSMARKTILLDTSLYPSNNPVISLQWEEPFDIRCAANSGFIAKPSKKSIDMMLRHIGASEWFEIPIDTTDIPVSYLNNGRASWLIKV